MSEKDYRIVMRNLKIAGFFICVSGFNVCLLVAAEIVKAFK